MTMRSRFQILKVALAKRADAIGPGVVTGADFVFGKGRQGDVVRLAEFAKDRGFFTEIVSPVGEEGEVISSSRIRDALKAGQCEIATHLLSRPFTIEGVVEHEASVGNAVSVGRMNPCNVFSKLGWNNSVFTSRCLEACACGGDLA